ncbi:hypothetical protein ACHAXR_009628 [Thalassiosira sp. AJA248-18]
MQQSQQQQEERENNDAMMEESNNLMWEEENNNNQASSSLENNHVIFTLTPPYNTIMDAMSVIDDLIVMAKNGQRRRRRRRRRRRMMMASIDEEDDEEEEEEELSSPALDDGEAASTENTKQHHYGRRRRLILRELSIQDAFSLAAPTPKPTTTATSSSSNNDDDDANNFWSRILSRGLEKEDEEEGDSSSSSSSSSKEEDNNNFNSCISLLEGIVLEPSSSSLQSSYEFSLINTNSTKSSPSSPSSSSSLPTTTTPECIASIIAGLSIHPTIINIGILSKTVQLDNANAQWVVQGHVVTTTNNEQQQQHEPKRRRPFFEAGLDGTGQVVSVSDTGLDVDNCYFKNHDNVGGLNDSSGSGSGSIIFDGAWHYSQRKVVKYDISKRGGDTSDTLRGHGTHVVGTIAGRHLLDDDNSAAGEYYGNNAKEGMAPASKIHFYDIAVGYTVTDPREHWFTSFHNDQQQHNPQQQGGAKIANGSWGFGYRESYDWICQLYDQLLVDYPDVLYVASAGNSGNKQLDGDGGDSSPYGTVGAPASCKNVFAVGATNSDGYGSNGLHYVIDFSSRGPTSDGRTKPDILAPGYALNSALSSGSSSSSSSDCTKEEGPYLKAGTSMSAPVISGMAALVRQYFQEGWYPCGSRGCNNSGHDAVIHPSGTLVKAVLANGAQYTKGVQVGGSSTVIPDQPVVPYDNTQNMGEVNLLHSLPLAGENDFQVFVQNETPLEDGETKSFYLTLDLLEESCSAALSATLTWYDPPGAIGCMKCLVNDLDLLVENLSASKKHFPNGVAQPDTMNNIERVRIGKRKTSLGDRYKVTVKASSLGPGYTTQNFSLVVTGCFSSVREEEDPTAEPTTQYYELPTTYQANRKQAGNAFGIKAKEDGVTITAFSIHTLISGRKVKLHLYTRNGGIDGDEDFLNDPSEWTMISPSAGIEVDAMGFGSPTLIPEGSFDPVPIAKGVIRSFYLSFIDEAEMLYKAVDSVYPTGAMYTSDGNIEIMTGVGKAANFGANWQSRQMNGAVIYRTESSGSTTPRPTPTPLPTTSPTNSPSNRPTKRPVVVQPPSTPILSMELVTTYKANKKQAGNMFDVFAKQDVTISSFKIHTLLKSAAVPMTIYTRLGSWENYDKEPSAWEKIVTINVDCQGYGNPTIVSGINMHIPIESGSTRAFYLTFDEEPELLYYYSEEYPSGSVYAEDSALKIMTGVGKGINFGTTYLSRQLNGAVMYSLS